MFNFKSISKVAIFLIWSIFVLPVTAQNIQNGNKAAQNSEASLLNMSVSGVDAHYASASQCNVNLTAQSASCNLTSDGSVTVELLNPNQVFPVPYSFSGSDISGNSYGPVTGNATTATLNFNSLKPGTYYINFNGNTALCPYGVGQDSVTVGLGPPLSISSQNPGCNLPNGSISVRLTNAQQVYPVQYVFAGSSLVGGNTFGPESGSWSIASPITFSGLQPGSYYINFNSANCQAFQDTFVLGYDTVNLSGSYNIIDVTCSGHNQFLFSVNGGTPPLSYNYSDPLNGNISGNSINDSFFVNNAVSGYTYNISGTDGLGCPFNGSAQVTGFQPYANQTICIVTVDSASGKNNIIWDQTPGVGNSYYKIYKQNDTSSQNDSIAIVNVDSLSLFVDLNSNPAQQNSTYSISVVDSCGDESNLSPSHTTIHLSANQGINGQVNLIWNTYVGFTYNNFEIYRSNNGSAFSLINSVSNTSTSYTDLTPPTGTNYYYVSVVNQAGCSPSRSYNSSISNILYNNTTGVRDFNAGALNVLRGNKTGLFILNLPADGRLCVYDNLGQRILNKSGQSGYEQLDLTQQAKGMYFIQFQTSDKIYYAKIVSE
jgi:fibronectin type 3 domain-containing protein